MTKGWAWQNLDRLDELLARVDPQDRIEVDAALGDLEVDAALGDLMGHPSEYNARVRVARLRKWPERVMTAYLPRGWRLSFEVATDQPLHLVARAFVQLL